MRIARILVQTSFVTISARRADHSKGSMRQAKSFECIHLTYVLHKLLGIIRIVSLEGQIHLHAFCCQKLGMPPGHNTWQASSSFKSMEKDLQGFTIGFDLQPGSLAAQPAGEHQP